MKWNIFPILGCLVLSLAAAQQASAAECACKAHEANANADGSCSLTESVDYCTISFSKKTPQELSYQQSQFEMKAAMITAFPNSNQLQLRKLDVAMENLDRYPEEKPTLADLTTVALASTPLATLDKGGTQFVDLFTTRGEAILEDFNADGCVEANADTFRILIIAANSKSRGGCEGN